jgi:hypothetical protein
MRNIHKILNTELTNKEIAAVGSDIITDSMFGVLPAMSLHKSEKEGRSKESSVIHAFGAIGAANALDFAEDKIVEKHWVHLLLKYLVKYLKIIKIQY